MIIVDSSVVFKWIVAEGPNQGEAAKLHDQYSAHQEEFTAPDVLLYELGILITADDRFVEQVGLPFVKKPAEY